MSPPQRIQLDDIALSAVPFVRDDPKAREGREESAGGHLKIPLAAAASDLDFEVASVTLGLDRLPDKINLSHAIPQTNLVPSKFISRPKTCAVNPRNAASSRAGTHIHGESPLGVEGARCPLFSGRHNFSGAT